MTIQQKDLRRMATNVGGVGPLPPGGREAGTGIQDHGWVLVEIIIDPPGNVNPLLVHPKHLLVQEKRRSELGYSLHQMSK